MDVKPLPRRPDLEQYRIQVEDLLKYCRNSEPNAVREWIAQWLESWPWMEEEAQLRGRAVTPEEHNEVLGERIERLLKHLHAGPDATLADAQLFIARAHGFESWAKFSSQVQALQRDDSPEAQFEAAVDAIVDGDLAMLERLLRENPQLIHMRSMREHRSTLLHYVAANGVEDYRQKTPKNAPEIARLLLAAGADVDAESDAYGGGSTALGLAATSVHPERAGVQEALMQILLDHGAVIDRPGVAGNRHTAVEGCLANGRGKAAAFLASRGAQLNLGTAAGAGRLDVVESCFDEGGGLRSATKEELQRGFLWACMHGRADVVEFLVDRGVDLHDQADTGATGLHWAAGGGHLGIVRLLLERNAPLEEINQWGGTVLEHAGWALVNGDPAVDYEPIFDALLAAGARIQDGWLGWLEKQSVRPAAERARLAELLRRYGAAT